MMCQLERLVCFRWFSWFNIVAACCAILPRMRMFFMLKVIDLRSMQKCDRLIMTLHSGAPFVNQNCYPVSSSCHLCTWKPIHKCKRPPPTLSSTDRSHCLISVHECWGLDDARDKMTTTRKIYSIFSRRVIIDTFLDHVDTPHRFKPVCAGQQLLPLAAGGAPLCVADTKSDLANSIAETGHYC